MKFFFDNCLPPLLAEALNVLCRHEGHTVVALREMFSRDPGDVNWIRALDEQGGWVVISKDREMRASRLEHEALRRKGLTTFFLAKGWDQKQFWDICACLLRWWPVILEEAKRAASVTLFEVPARYGSGKLKRL